jgi:hypothetical protein
VRKIGFNITSSIRFRTGGTIDVFGFGITDVFGFGIVRGIGDDNGGDNGSGCFNSSAGEKVAKKNILIIVNKNTNISNIFIKFIL